MTHYEPRERTPEWERLVEAHQWAAICVEEHEHPVSGVRLMVTRDAARKFARDAGMIWSEHALYRSRVCVAQWATAR